MHEVSLMKGFLEVALTEADRAGASRIERMRVKAGALSGVVPEALAFAFEVLAGESPVTAKSKLEIDRIPTGCRCRECGCDFEPESYEFECPRCRSNDAEILRGRELELYQLEIT